MREPAEGEGGLGGGPPAKGPPQAKFLKIAIVYSEFPLLGDKVEMLFCAFLEPGAGGNFLNHRNSNHRRLRGNAGQNKKLAISTAPEFIVLL